MLHAVGAPVESVTVQESLTLVRLAGKASDSAPDVVLVPVLVSVTV